MTNKLHHNWHGVHSVDTSTSGKIILGGGIPKKVSCRNFRKPWRGFTLNEDMPGWRRVDEDMQEEDCTVVPDSCCFPVKEAMAYMDFCRTHSNEKHQMARADMYKGRILWDKYLAAVAKMKGKK